jgi:hypothetical protein
LGRAGDVQTFRQEDVELDLDEIRGRFSDCCSEFGVSLSA